jgi:Aspartyl protease
MKSWIFMITVLFAGSMRGAAQLQTVATVPITFQGPMPVVEVTLNGQGPFRFTIDTGAALQVDIDSALAAKLNLQSSGKIRGGDPSGRNAQEFDTVAIDSIRLGGLEFRNLTAVSRARRVGPRPEAEGILGFRLFTEYLLTLDFPGKQIRLARGELPAAKNAGILTFENSHVIPVIEISIGNFKMKAHIDSGNMIGGFILPSALVDKLKLASEPVTVGRAHTVSNEVEIKEARLSDKIKLGSFEFKQPVITFPSIADEVNIGLKVLRDFSITFDQKNRRVKFERNSS